MNSLKLFVALVLHLSGLWGITPAVTKTSLIAGTTPPLASQIAAAPRVPILVSSPQLLSFDPGVSALAIDRTSGQILYQSGPTTPRPIASITKLMTVMVAMSVHGANDLVTIGPQPSYEAGADLLGVAPGEQFHFIDLVKATLIASDNDAADALGIATSGSLPKFYEAMNARAAKWGVGDAKFVSANGLIDDGNVVSAAAVARIASLDLAIPSLVDIIAQPSATITDLAGKSFNLSTTNQLLASGKFYGIKTGYTLAAGQCFVGITKIDGHEVITVILGSSDRFGQTQSLVNWIAGNWQWPQHP